MYSKMIIVYILLLITLAIKINGQQVDITAGPPAPDKPSVAGWGWFGSDHSQDWKQAHETLNNMSIAQRDHIKVLFLGDDLIAHWTEEGNDVWNQTYAPLGAYNYGLGADSTRQLLWRIANGELNGLAPHLAVLMVGTNNLYSEFNNGTDDEIALGIKTVVERLRAKLPQTKILVLSILPRDHWSTDRIQEINYQVSKLSDNRFVYYLDIGYDFEDTPGFLKTNLYQNNSFLLTKDGYHQWNQSMYHEFKRLLDPLEEGDITHKPPEKDKPWVEAWGWWGATISWKWWHENLVHQSHELKDKIKVVFLGDDLIARWDDAGKEIWDKQYATRGSYNYGVGADSTRQVIWRLNRGELDGLTPALVVLHVGTTNLYDDYNAGNDTEIAYAIKVIVALLREKLPQTRILLLGIIPRESHWLTDRIVSINLEISKLDDKNFVHFLDMSYEFEESPGFPNASLYQNNSYVLNKLGYQRWYETMEPTFQRLIDSKIEGDITHVPPAKDKPSVPAYGWWGEGVAWMWTHENLVHQSLQLKDKIATVFLGDDITAHWAEEGNKVWDKYYANRSAYNYGIGGDSTRQVLWRLAHAELDGLSPKVVVLMIGTHNFNGDDDFNSGTNEEVAQAIKLIAQTMRSKLPNTKLLLLGILPRDKSTTARIKLVNAEIAKLSDNNWVHYLDMSSHFQDAVNGTVKKQLYLANELQLTESGYQVWHDSMETTFAKLLQ